MSASSDLLNAPKEFLRLFNAGKNAARQGDKMKAHDLFRQAIGVDPYHEQVWLWLASVVETDEDRRVCFENVLELNPEHKAAKKQLRLLEQKALVETFNDHPLTIPQLRSNARADKFIWQPGDSQRRLPGESSRQDAPVRKRSRRQESERPQPLKRSSYKSEISEGNTELRHRRKESGDSPNLIRWLNITLIVLFLIIVLLGLLGA